MTILKREPCKKCNSNDIYNDTDDFYWLEYYGCRNCGHKGPKEKTQVRALDSWNKQDTK